ncbi:MAG: IS66 family transposase [Boseongicola sp. SB0676_bin_33]|nr:IS66 family transposase [Boseongicola sp. SB0676_bin_33]MYK31090.1 IS66 family transposase [Boseongicola sp. SB0670_bin_30]
MPEGGAALFVRVKRSGPHEYLQIVQNRREGKRVRQTVVATLDRLAATGAVDQRLRSRLGEKLAYFANHWDGLLVFLHDGRVEMDTNFVENRIRPLKLTKKNGLFAGHDEGTVSWARAATLIETCKMNGVEPYAWLRHVLERIATGHPMSRIHELLPWNFDARAGNR